ncbi:4561_t:CDS:2 [Cetraspora pellucida]|uniref:4561_t:CDS:1 n=1 Tax=Cetraspora pellucida TaxID=1433469 RepID=A0ACA9LN69_9GLOM|nr:4561_t:CDS:2 [Cetraspora pellucida]
MGRHNHDHMKCNQHSMNNDHIHESRMHNRLHKSETCINSPKAHTIEIKMNHQIGNRFQVSKIKLGTDEFMFEARESGW